jgi:hypothetical protein
MHIREWMETTERTTLECVGGPLDGETIDVPVWATSVWLVPTHPVGYRRVPNSGFSPDPDAVGRYSRLKHPRRAGKIRWAEGGGDLR